MTTDDNDDDDGGQYYYKVYCLEEEDKAPVMSRGTEKEKYGDHPLLACQQLAQLSSLYLTPLGSSGKYDQSGKDSIMIGKIHQTHPVSLRLWRKQMSWISLLTWCKLCQ